MIPLMSISRNFFLGREPTKSRLPFSRIDKEYANRVAREAMADIGIDVKALGPAWDEACAALSAAVKRRDLDGFERALESLGPILGATMPRSFDDVNELPDEVQ